MARKITGGLVGSSTLIGTIQINPDAALATAADQNITLSPGGTGIVVSTANIQLNAQTDLQFADSDSSNFIALQAPAVVGANYTLTLPAAVASRDKSVLTSSTAGALSWEPAKTFEYSTIASSFAAVAFGGYFVNTSAAVITATLPASPTVGDTIRFLDVAKTFDTNAFTVARNGKLIQGDAENLTVNSESAAFELIFSGDTFGWRIFSI
jgi:hypothetical protein